VDYPRFAHFGVDNVFLVVDRRQTYADRVSIALRGLSRQKLTPGPGISLSSIHSDCTKPCLACIFANAVRRQFCATFRCFTVCLSSLLCSWLIHPFSIQYFVFCMTNLFK
jgi:hypothetical protein